MDPDPDLHHDTGKLCLGGGMHCPSASSSNWYWCSVSDLFNLHSFQELFQVKEVPPKRTFCDI